MKYYAKSLVWIGLVALLKCQVANAAVHNISQGQLPICNNWNNSWSISGSTYTCSASVSFVAGDEYVANSPITLRADAGITLSGNKVGTVTSPITLQTTYGTLNATVGSSVVYGNLSTGSGALTLTGVSLTGNIQTSAKLTITQSAINGNVSGTGEGIISGSSVSGAVSFGHGFTGSDTTFASSVSSTVISLKNGSVSGSITGTNITLNGTNVDGKVTGTGTGSFTNLTIGNSVSMTNGLIATNTVFSSTLTSTNGAVTLFGGLVTGLVNVSCCKVTVSQGATISNGIVAGNNGIDIRDSTVTGDLKAGNNPIVMVNVNMTSGTISPGNNSLTITGGTVTADVTNAHRVFINDNAVVTGDVLARYEVSVSDSKVIGDIATVVGHDGLHHVYLNNSEVYGNVTVRDDWGTINGDESSRIYGVCTYKMVDPISLCEAGGGPGPIEPIECKVKLQVEHMVAGTQQEVKVFIEDQAECKKPAKLDFIFDYKKPEDPPAKLNISLNGGELVNKKGTISLDFDESNVASLSLQYDEVGELSLRIEDQQEELFVSRPARLSLSVSDAPPCDPQSTFSASNCPKFKEAGELFDLEVRAFNTKDIEVKNFEHSLGLEVVSEGEEDRFYPRNGQKPNVEKEAPEPFRRDLANKKITPQLSISDVGIVKVRAVVENYLGSGYEISGESEFIGRIIPAWLDIDIDNSNLSQEPGCPAPLAFTYQDQPTRLSGGLKVQGYNRNNKKTLNYRDEFWRVSADQVYGLYRSGSAPVKGERSHVESPDPDKSSAPLITLDPVNSQIQFSEDYIYPRQITPSDIDAPFDLKWIIWDLHDDDGVYVRKPSDAQPMWGAETEGFLVDGLIQDSKFHLGQLRTENLIVPYGNIGHAPIVLERWNGTTWEARADDGCTTLIPPLAADMPEQLSYPPGSGVTKATLDEWNQSMLEVTATEPSAPHGSVLLRHLLRSDGANATWLCQRSEGNASLGGVCSYQKGGDAETRSSITFGIYKGSKPLIFRREVYR